MYGKKLYMSPELLRCGRCTEKVDIYSLGVIYFEMNYVFTTRHEKDEVTSNIHCILRLKAHHMSYYAYISTTYTGIT